MIIRQQLLALPKAASAIAEMPASGMPNTIIVMNPGAGITLIKHPVRQQGVNGVVAIAPPFLVMITVILTLLLASITPED